jgi:ElaB/YqjD/DUF883 family membrane-anchored ribosome-binding protein
MEKVDQQLDAARRLARRGRQAAEEAYQEARYEIRKHPFEAVAASFGIGVGLGILSSWLFNHKGRK